MMLLCTILVLNISCFKSFSILELLKKTNPYFISEIKNQKRCMVNVEFTVPILEFNRAKYR